MADAAMLRSHSSVPMTTTAYLSLGSTRARSSSSAGSGWPSMFHVTVYTEICCRSFTHARVASTSTPAMGGSSTSATMSCTAGHSAPPPSGRSARSSGGAASSSARPTAELRSSAASSPPTAGGSSGSSAAFSSSSFAVAPPPGAAASPLSFTSDTGEASLLSAASGAPAAAARASSASIFASPAPAPRGLIGVGARAPPSSSAHAYPSAASASAVIIPIASSPEMMPRRRRTSTVRGTSSLASRREATSKMMTRYASASALCTSVITQSSSAPSPRLRVACQLRLALRGVDAMSCRCLCSAERTSCLKPSSRQRRYSCPVPGVCA
mmetsp:Transcript_27292/g.85929  ORF Transcript_27292/g.85929 Transcript_27292/m.85929 type:complete len:326 (+) Transcript_27292:955-1932(+)